MKEKRQGRRDRRPTDSFKFDSNHTLFAAKTRKCEEKKKEKEMAQERKKRYKRRKEEEKNGEEIVRLRALVKKQGKKIKALEKKISKEK